MLVMNREEIVISVFLLKHLEVLTYESLSVMASIITQKQYSWQTSWVETVNSHSHGSDHTVTYGEPTLFMHHCALGLAKRKSKTKVYPGQHDFLLTSNSGR